MSTALAQIAEQVRERVRRDGVDLGADKTLAARYVHDEVRRYSERALGGSVPLLTDEADATRQLVATLTGFGPLQPLFDDPEIEEVWINARISVNYWAVRDSFVRNSSARPKTSPTRP